MSRSRLIPLVAVILVVCLGATCLVGIVGGSFFLEQAIDDNTLVENTSVDDVEAEPPSQTTANDEDSDESTESTQQERPAPILPSGGPGEQVLTLPGGDPPTLDPHLSGDSTSARYVVELFSGLVTYDPNLELVPDLAETWDVSEDGMVYTFQLREDAKFHNGKPVRAQDFKWSIERACDFRTGSTTADTYLGDIVGCRDKLRGRVDEVEGVQVIADQVLEITIDEPKAYFLAKMTYPTAYVLDRENVERGGRTWTDNPNGTGPFKLEQFQFGEAIILAKNEDYYRDPRPFLDQINFSLTGGSSMIRYENDETDLVPVGINDIERVTDPNNPLNEDLEVATRMSVFYIGFNVNQPPFDDPEIRRAFNMALDKEKIVGVVYKETVDIADGVVPPGMPGYENPDLTPIPYDPDQALQIIYDSEYGDPSELPEITLYTSGAGGSPARITEAIIATYKEVFGIDISIQQTDWATFLADISQEDNPYQSYQLGWIADYPDPQNFLDILFHSESRQNHTGYSNPEVDQLLEAAGIESDAQKRLELYQQAEQIVVDEAAWVPLYFDIEYWLIKPWVQGYKIPPMIIPTFQYVYIEE